jgi:hypothetical protein
MNKELLVEFLSKIVSDFILIILLVLSLLFLIRI